MADRLVVMNEGRVAQIGSQQDLYERPADRFVAGFVGRSTFLEGNITAPGRFVTDGGLELKCLECAPGPAALALRPERIAFGSAETLSGMDNVIPGVLELASYLGPSIDLHIRVSPTDRIVVQMQNPIAGDAPRVGDRLHVGWPATSAAIFPSTMHEKAT